jgi:leucyl aminopeptidase
VNPLLLDAVRTAIPIHLVTAADWPAFMAGLPRTARAFAQAQGFEPAAGRHIILPNPKGDIAMVVCGAEPMAARRRDPFAAGRLAALLPAGNYRFAKRPERAELVALSWLLSGYKFDRYRTPRPCTARLVVPKGVDGADISRIHDAVVLARDLINTPANDLGPAELESAIRVLGAAHGANVSSVEGDELTARGFHMIHAVGKGSTRAPRLVDLTWGDPGHPRVTLVGKGICFDTGGYNIKPDASMLMMKKDMGGAATAIAAASMIMAAKLPVRLRLLVPCAENMISGSAFRPGDVLKSYKGLSVEIGNTDAEGRLVLGDALALGDEEHPALMIDYATLTGAARVALGPDLPPVFTHDAKLSADIARLGESVNDPVWPMPLWPPYDAMLDSKLADVNHISGGAFAGAITAALFLNRFVSNCTSYAHFDIFAWNNSTKPGRPEGGECMAARLTYALVKERYGAACDS